MKNIIKILIFMTVRQAWAVACNLYLLTYEPGFVIRDIREKNDKSQVLLIGMIFLLPLLGYIGARIVTDLMFYGQILKNVGGIFVLTMIIEVIIWGYLGYWVIRVLGRK